MKVLNVVCRYASALLGIAALVLFFGEFATIDSGVAGIVKVSGAELSFNGEVTGSLSDKVYEMFKSADILFCMILTALAAVVGAFGFKSKRSRIAAPIIALVPGIYMLVIALSPAAKFIDFRPLQQVRVTNYSLFLYLATGALLLCSVLGIAAILINDKLEVIASKGAKLSIPARVIRFLREYKSEIKKISWPNLRTVAKNTAIVLIFCAIFLAGIWLLDAGLGKLIEILLID